MTDEITPNAGSTEPVENSPVEQEARDSGWVPKEEYKGDEHRWVAADEFLRRGELFKKIEDQSKQLKDVRSALNEMKKLHGQVREVEYKRALDALREQKKTALLEGDAEGVIAADERIDLVKEQVKQHQAEPVQEQSGQEHPDFVSWKEQNSWYSSNKAMRAFADALGQDLAGAGNSPQEVLRKVAVAVRKEFTGRFQNPNQSKPGSVEASTERGVSKGNFTLTDQQRKIMNNLVRQGVITEKKYIEDLKSVL